LNTGSPLAILPAVRVNEPNDAIALYTGSLAAGGAEGDGTVSLEWVPTPRLMFRLEHIGPPVDLDSAPSQRVILKDKQAQTTGMFTGAATRVQRTEFTQVLRGRLDKTSIGEPREVARVLFHVPNWPTFLGAPIRRDKGRSDASWRGRMQFEDDVWTVTLDDFENHRGLMDKLNSVGGYCLTAAGEIRRRDSALFSVATANTVMESLRYFLSLVAGAWTDCVIRIGFSREDEPIWEEWQSPSTDPWFRRRSMFPEHVRDGDYVREPRLLPVFRAIQEYWPDSAWSDVVRWAISWLIESDKAVNADTSIILSQGGLELLAWAELVLREGMNPDDFRNLPAHAALRSLLAALAVPTRVPNGTILDEMHPFVKENGVDAPEAFTRVRNAIVHPRRGEKRPSGRLRIEAAQLGLWYLQLAILRLLSYDDVYLDRLRAWRPQTLPWA
jgi:hypothetical protein